MAYSVVRTTVTTPQPKYLPKKAKNRLALGRRFVRPSGTLSYAGITQVRFEGSATNRSPSQPGRPGSPSRIQLLTVRILPRSKRTVKCAEQECSATSIAGVLVLDVFV